MKEMDDDETYNDLGVRGVVMIGFVSGSSWGLFVVRKNVLMWCFLSVIRAG